MKRTRAKVIYFAVALSIAAHFLLGPLVHVKFVDAAPEPTPGRIQLITVPKPVPTKPPLPRKVLPRKPARTKPATQRAPRVADSHDKNTAAVQPGQIPNVGTTGDAGPGTTVETGTQTGGPIATPTPSPTPKPVCSAPYVEAATVDKYTPEMPAMARDQGLTGAAQVQVDLSASGKVVGAKIFASTGSTILDEAAVDAAKRTTYSPKVVDCDRVPGSYLFRVDFENN